MGGVIKAGAMTGGAAAENTLFQFDDMGNSYLAKVRQEANQIIAAARAEAEKVKASALEEGKKNAAEAIKAQVQAKVEDQLRTIKPALDAVLKELQQSRQAFQNHLEGLALKIAVSISQRLTRGALRHNPDITLQWIREALELAANAEQLSVRLNPSDYATLGDRAKALGAQLATAGTIEIVSDATVSLGGCRVHTEFGVIDQQLESQLSRIDEELL